MKRAVQVPDGYSAGEPTPLNPGLVIQRSASLAAANLTVEQVHLHHLTPGAVSVSWATAPGCEAQVQWGKEGAIATGVTRTYPTARLSDGTTAAAFHHVLLDGLIEGAQYQYTLRCRTGDAAARTFQFAAPRSTLPASEGYSFAIFGDTGTSAAAHDTLRSIGSRLPALDFAVQIGDISYGRGHEAVWNEFMNMIEPVASQVPWDIAPGNHDVSARAQARCIPQRHAHNAGQMRPTDSAGECGVPTLARFETPRSRAAFPEVLKLSPTGSGATKCDSFNGAADTDPWWYSVALPHATLVTYSTDSNMSAGSRQYEWLARELAAANTPAARAERPWLLLAGHKPMYTASAWPPRRPGGPRPPAAAGEYPGELPSRGEAHAGEGTEAALTAALEALFVEHKVDVSFYGHIHSYNRMYPVKGNGSWVDRSSKAVYRRPQAPVHMMIGMSGAGHLGAKYDDSQPWSAYSEISYGWCQATFANSTALHLEFIANGDGGLSAPFNPSVHDEVWITK